MNLLVVTLTYNEAAILPYWLRHYEKFADRIVVYDSGSTDGTLDILKAHPLVELRHRPPTNGVIDDVENIKYKTLGWKDGYGDWVITCDADEFIWDADVRKRLEECDRLGFNAIQSEAYDMIGDAVPTGPEQITEYINHGVRSPHFDKTLLFKPGTDMKHEPGCHEFKAFEIKLSPQRVKLLHYKWLSLEHVMAKRENLKMSEANHKAKYGYCDGVPSRDIWVGYYMRCRDSRKPLDFLTK